eukprot:PLAT3092.1.p1 GENE.PLAT3092.1~~PLAT3092.1.p1  ORF type:complete len:190 (-),score=29.77 PLAT3092.1:130-699(-)
MLRLRFQSKALSALGRATLCQSARLTHVDEDSGRPTMVDVGDKTVTKRTAKARAKLWLPDHVLAALRVTGASGAEELLSSKGAVFTTASIAGVMGAKRTSELIPFCHPLPLDKVDVALRLGDEPGSIIIDCTANVTHRTGVEMEALTGATVAALTVYDMCKALSHDIRIEQVHLLSKSGGRRTFERDDC